MASFLVDYENVRHLGLAGIETLSPTDHVYIFYGNKNHVVPITTFEMTNLSEAIIDIYNSGKTGKNYLDFQIATFLGSLVEAGIETEIFIITKDIGFDAVIDFWRTRRESPVIRRQLTLVTPKLVPNEEDGGGEDRGPELKSFVEKVTKLHIG